MEITAMHLLLGLLAGAIPVLIIFLTLKFIRKKRESNNEQVEREQQSSLDPTEQLKSVKEERMEKKGIRKTKN